jgi:hypothetical protein
MKTSELSGAALDWAVAKCEGLLCFGYRTDGERFAIEDSDGQIEGFMPSTDWAQSGPIIERERISVWARGDEWAAESFTPNEQGHEETGETPLIAAMRCYVASKLGDEVQIPEELTHG